MRIKDQKKEKTRSKRWKKVRKIVKIERKGIKIRIESGINT
jgi:hypothetical protein